MFGLLLAAKAEAAQAATSSGVDLMTLIGGIVSGLVLGLGGLLYGKAPGVKPPESAPIHEANVFFQGPFQAILDRINTAVLTLERIGGLSTELRETFSELLRSTRHDLKNVMQVMGQAQERDAESIKDLVRGIERALGEMQRDVEKTIAELRIEIVRGKGR